MAVGAIVGAASSVVGSNNNKETYGLKGSELNSSGSQLAGVIPYNNLPTDRKATTNDYGYAVARSILDPSGIFMKGKKKKGKTIEIPEYYLDPYYQQTQDQLYSTGSGLVSGNVNDYYKAIGDTGSPEFEAMLGLGTRDIQKAGIEAMARTGVRGARGASGIAKAVGDYETQNRYADYARALQGKEFLLGTGLNTLQSVRSGALTQSEMLNNYNFQKINAQMGLQNMANAAASAGGSSMGSLAATAANLYGAFSANKGSAGGTAGAGSTDVGNVSTELGDYSATKYGGASYNIGDYYKLGSAS